MRTEKLSGLTVRLCGGTDGNGGGTGPMVVLMHGFGAPGTDLVGLAAELDVGPTVRFAFPEAPLTLPAEFGPGRAWWMIDVMRLQMAMMSGKARDLTREVPEGLTAARERIVLMVDELVLRFGVVRQELVLGGFSQGAMLACDFALRTPEPLAGLALMSGTLLCEDEWLPLMPKREGLKVLVTHGRQDPLLPFMLAERLRDELVMAGLSVTFIPFDGGHGIAPIALAALADLIAG
ncbi:MAG: phospholipase [Myxococcales bacterium]|nr:phospholipase [Myxococcales bacterium]